MRQLSIGLVLVLAALCLAGDGRTQPPARGTDVSDLAAVVRSANTFAFELYRKIAPEDANVVFSPASVQTVLAMAYGGARGETANQMRLALQLKLAGDSLHMAEGELLTRINDVPKLRHGKGQAYELTMADAIWGQKGMPITDEYHAIVRNDYRADVNEVNFLLGDTARTTINSWVAEKTEGKILDLIPPGGVDRWTRLVLTNAIYFKSTWAKAFAKDRTRPEEFHPASGNAVQTPMMSRSDDVMYAETDSLQMLELPYAGEYLSMIIFLPRSASGLPGVEKSISPQAVEAFLKTRRRVPVDVFLPRFTFTKDAALSGALKELGMPAAFTGGADFTGMSAEKGLYISQIFHKAYVAVDEEGTEAAAATGGVMGVTSVQPGGQERKVFRADHPFLFLIRHNATGSILFLGRVANPAAA